VGLLPTIFIKQFNMYIIIGIITGVCLFWFILISYLEYKANSHDVKKFKHNLKNYKDEKNTNT
jgi:hypothetical protein